MAQYRRTFLIYFIITFFIIFKFIFIQKCFCESILSSEEIFKKELYNSLYEITRHSDFIREFGMSYINSNFTMTSFYKDKIVSGFIINDFISKVAWQTFFSEMINANHDFLYTKEKIIAMFYEHVQNAQKQYEYEKLKKLTIALLYYNLTYFSQYYEFIAHDSTAEIFITTNGFYQEQLKLRNTLMQESILSNIKIALDFQPNEIIISIKIFDFPIIEKKIKG